jgi:hypothetical protein
MPTKPNFGLSLIACLFLAFSPGLIARAQDGRGKVRVPKDTELLVELLSPISAEANKKGDEFSCVVISPEGFRSATVSGRIEKAKRSGKGKGKSELVLKFDSVTFEREGTFGLNAQIKEVYDAVNVGDGGKADPEGTVKSKSRLKIGVKRAVAGAIIGGIIGGAIAGPKGAAAGAAIGASAGVSTTLVTEGPNLEFKQGTRFLLLVNAPSRQKQ